MVNRVGIGVSQKQQHFALRTIYLVSTGSVFYRSHTGEMCVCVCVCVYIKQHHSFHPVYLPTWGDSIDPSNQMLDFRSANTPNLCICLTGFIWICMYRDVKTGDSRVMTGL